MQKQIQILVVNPTKTGVAKNGKPYAITECECVVHGPEGLQVGVLTLGRSIDATKVKAGHYLGTFDVSVNYKDRRIGAEIVDLQLVDPGASKPATAAAKA